MASTTVDTYKDGKLVGTRTVELQVEQANADATLKLAEQAIDGLRALKNTSGPLNLIALSGAVRLLATALLALIRLQLERHEETDA